MSEEEAVVEPVAEPAMEPVIEEAIEPSAEDVAEAVPEQQEPMLSEPSLPAPQEALEVPSTVEPPQVPSILTGSDIAGSDNRLPARSDLAVPDILDQVLGSSVVSTVPMETKDEDDETPGEVKSLSLLQTLFKAIHKMRVPGESRTSFAYEPNRRLSMAEKKKIPNTYQMQPPRVFKSHLAESVIRDAIDERVSKTMKYNALKCRKLSIDLADLILRRVKRLGFKRYRFVTQIHVGQMEHASVKIASRCCWEQCFDTFASFSFKNAEVYIVAEVYAVCLE